MRFDQTFIAIRKRNLLEIFDLALHVCRDYVGPLSILWLLGVAPFAIANWLALGWLLDDIYDNDRLSLYCFLTVLLVANQAQVATTFVTAYLGQAIFNAQPSIWSTIKAVFRVNPWFFWVHGILRLVIPVLWCAFAIRRSGLGDSLGWQLFFLTALVAAGLMIRAARPFVSEILLLERTPVRVTGQSNDGNQPIRFAVRSASLHKAASSELTGRFIIASVFAVPLFFVLHGSLLLIDSMLDLFPGGSPVPVAVYGSISLWLVAGLMAVVRFLSYIDIRIRQEGWEVELRLRAEAMKLEEATGA